ncbi:MAG: hypothetical protein QOF98_2002 [Streptomyces sp.]|nr:hypothetical protein [Streptomyces sp.]
MTAAEAEFAADDEALYVLTAAMLTPGQFPGVLGDDYPSACAGLGLEPLDLGYGLVFGQDGTGARWTVATTDAAMVACALAAWDCGLEYDLAPDEDSMAASLPGWPLPVAVAVPGVPAPHDPDEETGGGPPLAPPDTSVWGPAQRRLGADEIAVHWREWRDQFAEVTRDPAPAAPTDPADAAADAAPDTAEAVAVAVAEPTPDTAPEAVTADEKADEAATDPGNPSGGPAAPAISHDGVRRVLEAAQEYVRNPPPPGRVRSAYGAVRADGPGWSLVARTDDMAFVLLDDVPGEILPVGRGPSLPPLLEALGKLAADPLAANPPTVPEPADDGPTGEARPEKPAEPRPEEPAAAPATAPADGEPAAVTSS